MVFTYIFHTNLSVNTLAMILFLKILHFSSLGYETAKSLAFHGATIIMACRNTEKAEKCKSNILKDRPKATIEILHLDLASLRSVKQFAEEYKRRAW